MLGKNNTGGGTVTLLFKNGQLGKIKGKVVAGSTTTRPDYPLTISLYNGISSDSTGGHTTETKISDIVANSTGVQIYSNKFAIGSSNSQLYVPMFCDNFESLKTCTISGGIITYTSWLEV